MPKPKLTATRIIILLIPLLILIGCGGDGNSSSSPPSSAPAASTQITISNTTGTFTNSQTVTITGSNFGTKSPAKPLVWADFEDGTVNPTNLGRITSWDRNNMSITTSGQDVNSTYSLRGMPCDPIAAPSCSGVSTNGLYGNASVAIYNGTNSVNATSVYVFMKRKYDDANWWINQTSQTYPANYKYFRLWTNPLGVTPVYPDSVFVFGAGDSVPTFNFITEFSIPNCSGVTTQRNTVNPGPPATQIWNREEYQVYRNYGACTANLWINGTLLQNFSGLYTSGGSNCDYSPYTDTWAAISLENYWTNTPPPQSAFVYYDDIYIDDSWAKVMIGNQSTFTASTHSEIQIPSAWTSTSITITVHQGSLNTGNAYLYVIDSNGNVNANGFLVQIQ